jgi:hypothetical protein
MESAHNVIYTRMQAALAGVVTHMSGATANLARLLQDRQMADAR